jgi:hypothetical protein
MSSFIFFGRFIGENEIQVNPVLPASMRNMVLGFKEQVYFPGPSDVRPFVLKKSKINH